MNDYLSLKQLGQIYGVSSLKDSDYEQRLADHPSKLSERVSSNNVPLPNLGHISTFGTEPKPRPFSTACDRRSVRIGASVKRFLIVTGRPSPGR